MKKFMVFGMIALFALSLVVACGQQVEDTDETTAAGAVEEVMDTTRMDSAMVDSMMPDTAAVTEAEGWATE